MPLSTWLLLDGGRSGGRPRFYTSSSRGARGVFLTECIHPGRWSRGDSNPDLVGANHRSSHCYDSPIPGFGDGSWHPVASLSQPPGSGTGIRTPLRWLTAIRNTTIRFRNRRRREGFRLTSSPSHQQGTPPHGGVSPGSRTQMRGFTVRCLTSRPETPSALQGPRSGRRGIDASLCLQHRVSN